MKEKPTSNWPEIALLERIKNVSCDRKIYLVNQTEFQTVSKIYDPDLKFDFFPV